MSISLHPDTPRGRTLAGSPVASAGLGAVSPGARNRSGLFIKYVALFVAVVGVALLANGSFEVFFYFRRESEPYMTLAVAGTRKDAGVSIAEVNLKLIWDVVSQIKVGEHGRAYVVAAQGRLIAHPDISLVLRNTDMSKLPQVQAAQAEQAGGT